MKFELCLDKGDAIAIVKGGKMNGEIIHICDVDAKKPGRSIESDDLDILVTDFFRNVKGTLTLTKIDKLYTALKDQRRPKEIELMNLYDQALNVLNGSKGKEIVLKSVPNGKGAIMKPIWDYDMERQVFYVTGMSGSGKSVFAGDLIEMHLKMYPDRPVYVFSNKPEDPALDCHEIIRVPMDEGLYEEPMTLENFRDSLVIFDDVEAIFDKKVSSEIDRLRDLILQQGRSYHVDFVYISHLANNYKHTRTILNECNSITIFPRHSMKNTLKYLLEKYLGFGKHDLAKLYQLPTRWATIIKSPPAVLYETGVYLLN